MNQGFIIPVILLVVMVGLMLVAWFASRRRIRQFEQACRDRGWTVERGGGPAFDQRISGETDGIPWQYESYQYQRASSFGGAGTSVSYTRWRTQAVSLPGEIVLAVPAVGRGSAEFAMAMDSIGKLGGLGRMFVEMFVTGVLRGDSSDVEQFMRLKPVESGSGELRQYFSLLATNEDAAAKFLKQGERALLDWATNPGLKSRWKHEAILLWGKGLVIPASQTITDITLLEAIANQGTTIASGLKGW